MTAPVDKSVSSVARIYNVLLAGKDNFEADRRAADEILEIEPEAANAARQNRCFLRDNVHEVAQSVAPESRVVYVDNDPVVLKHARHLLASSAEGRCAYIDADLRDTGTIIDRAARTLDFGKPVAVLLVAIMHFIADEDDPWSVVRRLMAAVSPGSYPVLSHATPEHLTDAGSKDLMDDVYAARSGAH